MKNYVSFEEKITIINVFRALCNLISISRFFNGKIPLNASSFLIGTGSEQKIIWRIGVILWYFISNSSLDKNKFMFRQKLCML